MSSSKAHPNELVRNEVELHPSTTHDPDAKPACFTTLLQEFVFVFTVSSCMAMGSLLQGASIVLTASIGSSLNMTQAEITWITASNALTAGSFLLFFGQLADVLGKKVLLLVGLVAFSACMLISAFATNPLYMNIMGGFLGICAAAITPSAVGIMGVAYPKPSRRKNRAFSVMGAANPIGFVLGSIIAGAISKPFHWKGAYISLAIIGVAITALASWSIPPQTALEYRKKDASTLRQFDVIGSFLNIAGLTIFTAALTMGPSAPRSWSTPYIIAMIVLGASLIFAFVCWEHYAGNPLMPLQHWKNRDFTLILLTSVLGFMAFTSTQFWLSLNLQEVRRLSALQVAVYLIPQAIAGILFNIIAGLLMHRVPNQYLMLLGAGCYTAGPALLANMKKDSSYWAFIFPALILMVVGADFQMNIVNVFVLSRFPKNQQAQAGGIVQMLVRFCVTLGLAFTTVIYSSAQEQGANVDIMTPYNRAFYLCAAIAGVSALLCPWMRIGTQGRKAGTVRTQPTETLKEKEATQEKNVSKQLTSIT